MWDTIVDGLKSDNDIQDIIEVESIDSESDEDESNIIEPDIFNDEKKPVIESAIRKRHMSFIEQNVNSEDNKKEGWSNPVLSNNKELNLEVLQYQSILKKLNDCNGVGEETLKMELDMSFRRIAGYYSNYEYRWYGKIGYLFDEPDLFYDFFYDLLRDCIEKFDASRESKVYENDFRKAGSGVYFNQYFFGSLSKRKITSLKKTLNTANHPSIVCRACGEDVTKISEYHLRHQYDENRIKKEFKMIPTGKGEEKIYQQCPLCDAQNVSVDHIKTHSYAESMTVNDYIERYPKAPLSGCMHSLQEPLMTSGEGDILTYEDLYLHTVEANNSPAEMSMFSAHIDDVLKDDQFTAEVIKLKMMDYKDNEIAEELGDSRTFNLSYEISKNMKKSEIYEYAKSNMIHVDFFQKHKSKFHIVSRTRDDGFEVFCVSSCAPAQVNLAIKKLRKNKDKIKELFGDFVTRHV